MPKSGDTLIVLRGLLPMSGICIDHLWVDFSLFPQWMLCFITWQPIPSTVALLHLYRRTKQEEPGRVAIVLIFNSPFLKWNSQNRPI